MKAEERLENCTPGKAHPSGGFTSGDVWSAVLIAREAIELLRIMHNEHVDRDCGIEERVSRLLDGEP